MSPPKARRLGVAVQPRTTRSKKPPDLNNNRPNSKPPAIASNTKTISATNQSSQKRPSNSPAISPVKPPKSQRTSNEDNLKTTPSESHESLYSMQSDSDASGIISNPSQSPAHSVIPNSQLSSSHATIFPSQESLLLPCSAPCTSDSTTFSQSQDHTNPTPQKAKNTARIDLQTIEDIPQSTRQVYLTSKDNTRKLTNINPIKLKLEIDNLCGPVLKTEYLQSGSILITTDNFAQIEMILKCTCLPSLGIPTTANVAWTRQFSYGKLFAREFSHDTLEELLQMLKPHNVIAIRKLFSDPDREHVPLYVLTFLGPKPATLTLGYIKYEISTYYSTPMRCRKCWRLRHSTGNCQSKPTCSFCASTDHTRKTCTSNSPKCISCKGSHESTSTNCPDYISEVNVCTVQADEGISFAEARTRTKTNHQRPYSPTTAAQQTNMPSQPPRFTPPITKTPTQPRTNNQNPPQSQTQPEITSSLEFPPLIQRQTIKHNKTHNEPIINDSQGYEIIAPWQQNHQPRRIVLQEYSPPIISLPATQTNEQPEMTFSQPPNHHHQTKTHYNTAALSSQHQQPDTASQNAMMNNSPIQNPTQISPLQQSIAELLPKILPLLIKLIFANSIPDKVECLIQIGQILQLDSIVTAALSSLQLSSSSSQ